MSYLRSCDPRRRLPTRKTVRAKAGARSKVRVATRRSLARGSRIKVRVVLSPLAKTAVSKPTWTVAVRTARTGKTGSAK